MSKPAVPGGTALAIKAVRGLNFQGYIASSWVGVDIGPHSRDVNISNSQFINIGKQALIVRSGSTNVDFNHNVLEDIGALGTNLYDAIFVETGSSGFRITSNDFGTYQTKNKPRYLINVLQGKSDHYVIGANNFSGGYGTAAVNDGGTGSGGTYFGNTPSLKGE